MILLTSTSDLLQVITGSAGNIDVHASWMDNASGTITPGRTNSAIDTAATTDIVASPASSTQRNVKTLNIRNAHASNSNTVTVQHTDGTTVVELFKVALSTGEAITYVDGVGWGIYDADGSHKAQSGRLLFKCLNADDVGGQNVNTAQPWFPTAGAVAVEAVTSYFFEGQLFTTRAAGTTSHTTGILFGGTATLTDIGYLGWCKEGDTNALADISAFWSQAATSLVVKAASTSGTENTILGCEGIVRINAAGTFIPQFIYSSAPGGAPTIKEQSYFRMWPIGDNTTELVGTWT